jgi:hypothetical protein
MAEAMGYSTDLTGPNRAQMITLTHEVVQLEDFPTLVEKIKLTEGHIYDDPHLFEALFADLTQTTANLNIQEIVPLLSTCYYQKVTTKVKGKTINKLKRGMFVYLDGIKDIKGTSSQLIEIITGWFEASSHQEQTMVDLVIISTNVIKIVTELINPFVVKYGLGQIQPRCIPLKSFLLSAFTHYLSPTISIASEAEVKEIIETSGGTNTSVFPLMCRDDPLAIGYDVKSVLAIRRQNGELYYRLVRGTMISRSNTIS